MPLLPHDREDKYHLLTCPHEDCAETWQNSLLGLEAWMIETDTAPAIRDCLLPMLATRNPAQSFAHFSLPMALRAAQAQDKIGWMHTTEGKISKQWQQIQKAHYRNLNSRRSPTKWAAGLITNLLSVTHSQWLHRCAVEHERDAQGLKLKEGQELTAAITAQLALEVEGLHARDRHYITRGRDHIFSLPAANKKAWLSGICIARETYLASEARDTDSMRACMLHWLAQVYHPFSNKTQHNKQRIPIPTLFLTWSPQLVGVFLLRFQPDGLRRTYPPCGGFVALYNRFLPLILPPVGESSVTTYLVRNWFLASLKSASG